MVLERVCFRGVTTLPVHPDAAARDFDRGDTRGGRGCFKWIESYCIRYGRRSVRRLSRGDEGGKGCEGQKGETAAIGTSRWGRMS